MDERGEPLIRADNVQVWFPVRRPRGFVRAVDGISLEVRKGETLGIVGESGSGKSTLGRAVLGIQPITGGTVFYRGQAISKVAGHQRTEMRRRMQMVFQDPYASLDPRQRIGDCIAEPILTHHLMSKEDSKYRALELLETVGLSMQHYYRRPHEFSGGQRQRIGIARALALNPEFIVCDEPVSALDVSIQASILNLISELQDKMDLTYMFISHDLRVVRYIADRVAVMYLGTILEQGDTSLVYSRPLHPYTKTLISAIPEAVYGGKKERIMLEGEMPNPMNPPSGCRLRNRCPFASERCAQETPALKEMEKNHLVACHLASEING